MPVSEAIKGNTVQISDLSVDLEVLACLEDRYEPAAAIWLGQLMAAGQEPLAVFATDAAAEHCHRASQRMDHPGNLRIRLVRMNSMYWAWEVTDL